jgi:hypothetical protein
MTEPDYNNQAVLEYVRSFQPPAEIDFFDEKQKAKLKAETEKLQNTQKYLRSIVDNPDLGKNLEKDVVEGKIYSAGEMVKISERIKALEGYGERISPKQSLVSPTGQRVIISDEVADILGFITDGYILPEELEDLIIALKHEGILDDEISKLKSAMAQHGAIILQRGVFAALFPILEESVQISPVLPVPKAEPVHGASLEMLKRNIETVQEPAPTKPELPREQTLAAASAIAVQPDIPVAEQIKKVVMSHKTDSAESLKRIFDPKVEPASKQAVPMQASTQPHIVPPSDEIKSIDDLSKITPAFLRKHGDVKIRTEFIRHKIIELSQAANQIPYHAVNSFERSPLFRIYLLQGSAMITGDQRSDFAAATKLLTDKGMEVLSQDEFEAMADLRREIEKL